MDLKFHTLRKSYHSPLIFLLDLSLIGDAVRAGPELNSNVWHRPTGTRAIKLVTIFSNLIATESASVHRADSGRHRHLWIRRTYNGATRDVDFYLVTGRHRAPKRRARSSPVVHCPKRPSSQTAVGRSRRSIGLRSNRKIRSGLIRYSLRGENNKRMKSAQLTTVLASPVATFFAAILLSGALVGANAAEPSDEQESQTEKLAKETQNPIANLISVPFQNNFNFGIGPNDATQWVLNIQPVIPITLNKDWNLITRTIVPIINQPSPAPGIRSAFGLGDINPSLFLSPANSGKLIWGVGPTMTFPTATDSMLGNGKWSAGPGLVVLTMPGHWVLGALANNQWSFAGWGKKSVNSMLVQPFVNYNFPHGWYFTTSPIITANWLAASNDRWTVPIGGGFGKLFRLGKLPVNTQLAAYSNVVKPRQGGADWQLRFQVQFLFPK